ncbi:site-specific integrase [Rhizobium sp. BJ04]|uniref:site-specific integrase n=1 Tax=Rhizobium binxianense TaxID=3024242 RepID=UPI0023AA0FC5|nr:site-specific integrase [Rhizobium sp. BJ04]WEA59538.1 site-specific integrase [Rhizobium sp. BJ04]
MKVVASGPFPDLPGLPSSVLTKEGATIDPREAVWVIPSIVGTIKLRFDQLAVLPERNIHCLRLVFLWLIRNHSVSHAANLNQCLRFFLRISEEKYSSLDVIEIVHIQHFASKLSKATMWRLGILRILLRMMSSLGYGITSAEALLYLESMSIPKNPMGTSIRTRDPNSGAFNDLELIEIQAVLNDKFAEGEISLYAYAIVWLLLGYGSRSVQIASLKEHDLLISREGETTAYALRVPRAKQKGKSFRDEFKVRYCSRQIGGLLERVIEHNRQIRAEHGLAGEDWPMFMTVEAKPEIGFHLDSKAISSLVGGALGAVMGFKTNPRRFRITLGQRAVDDGKDRFTVADLLDHSDTQTVKAYYEASPALVARLDKHLALELAPVAQAFAGVLVEDEREAKRGDDLGSRIYDRSLRDNVDARLGNCGQMSFCGLVVPYACYTCRHFQPWIDGPHEALLAVLLVERERMLDEGLSAKIYSIRDRTILAIAQVIQMCAERRSGLAYVHG